jgi:predicted ATPase/class 3 adenylate cyclase
MVDIPTGNVTFLFTDIEGSTRLLHELGETYREVQDDHMRLMREAIASGGGTEIKTEGDAFFAAFPTATGAAQAAVSAQRALHAHAWPQEEPLRVRMGMHTGEGRRGGDDYLGIDVNRAARISAAGHGGQVLVSDSTRSLVQDALPEGVTLRDLGEHRLKDLVRPEHLFDLVIEDLPSEFPPLKSLEIPTNLPAHLTSFIGREREVRQVTDLMGRSRLVTLTGPGGTGKTRLAVEAASRLLDGFPDGVFFVDLSPITDPRLVPDTIATALLFRQESSGRPSLDIVTDHLRDRTAFLLLDNFEQVLDGAETVAVVLRAAQRVRSLVTSRAPLGLSGEQEFPVPPLTVPDAGEDPATLRGNEAVALFAERAAAVDPSFALTEEKLPIVAEVCARLDGLPLAIELAASRVRLLPLPSLLEQLERRLPTLVGGPRDAPVRQRTLEAAIAWSHDLLEEPARAMFRRLAVYAGGWTPEAAGDVVDPGRELGDPTQLLEQLLQHSLIQRVPDDPDGRLHMLETIREFGLARLDESGEGDDVRLRHAERFVELAEEAEPYLTGPEQRRWLDLLGREHDNLRAALDWAIGGDRGTTAMRLSAAAWRFWYARGHLEEGRRWLEAALSLPSSRERGTARARCLTAKGGILYWQSDFEDSDAAYGEALEIYRELGDRAGMVQALFNLGNTRSHMGDIQTGESLVQESLATARELGDRRGEAWALWALGAFRFFGGDFEGAQERLEESLRIFEEVGSDTWGLGNALAILSDLAMQRGDLVAARELNLRALDTWEDQGNALVVASQLRFLAMIAHKMGRAERAVRLAAVASAWLQRVGGRTPDAFFPFDDPDEAAAKLLDDATVERARAEGAAMSLEEALAYAREDW